MADSQPQGSCSLARKTEIASANAARRSPRPRPALAGGLCSEISNFHHLPNRKGKKKTAPVLGRPMEKAYVNQGR